jgi:hypothetical protein
MTGRLFHRCARCGEVRHRDELVHSRFTGNYYCYRGHSLARCLRRQQLETAYLAEHFDTPQGVIFS